MEIVCLKQGDTHYPSQLRRCLDSQVLESIAALGNLDLLQHKTLALFCSVKCPGNLILQTYDLAKQWREAGITVIGGFHSPMERECLTILLRGKQPVIVSPARSIEGMRLRGEYEQPLADGRLLLLSPFEAKQRRITADAAVFRNRFVAALADAVFVAYAEPGGKTEHFCRDIVLWSKRLYTLDDGANANLLELGAKPIPSHELLTFPLVMRNSIA